MKRYETIFISHADLPADEQKELIERYKGIIESLDGTIIKIDEWGKRRLAYLIQKRHEGYYVLFDYAGESGVVKEFERNLKIDDAIMRYQTVRLADDIDNAEVERIKMQIVEEKKPQEQKPEDVDTASSVPVTDDATTEEAAEEAGVSETEPEELSKEEAEG